MQPDDTLFRFSLLMLFVPVLLGGGFGLMATFSGLRRRRVMAAWPAVRARVSGTEVSQGSYRGLLGSKELAWDLLVEYEYEVSGDPYTGRVSLEVPVPRSRKTVSQEVVDEAVDSVRARLAQGLVLHVNPANPAMSMLAVEASGWVWLRLGLFGAAVAVSVAALGIVFSS